MLRRLNISNLISPRGRRRNIETSNRSNSEFSLVDYIHFPPEPPPRKLLLRNGRFFRRAALRSSDICPLFLPEVWKVQPTWTNLIPVLEWIATRSLSSTIRAFARTVDLKIYRVTYPVRTFDWIIISSLFFPTNSFPLYSLPFLHLFFAALFATNRGRSSNVRAPSKVKHTVSTDSITIPRG